MRADLQFERRHLVAPCFDLFFVLVDLEPGDLVDHMIESLVHLGEFRVAVVHIRPGRQVAAADPVHGVHQHVHGPEYLLFHVDEQERDGRDDKHRRQHQQHLIAAHRHAPVLVRGQVIDLQQLYPAPDHQLGAALPAHHPIAVFPMHLVQQPGLGLPQQQLSLLVADQHLPVQAGPQQQLFKQHPQVNGSRQGCFLSRHAAHQVEPAADLFHIPARRMDRVKIAHAGQIGLHRTLLLQLLHTVPIHRSVGTLVHIVGPIDQYDPHQCVVGRQQRRKPLDQFAQVQIGLGAAGLFAQVAQFGIVQR